MFGVIISARYNKLISSLLDRTHHISVSKKSHLELLGFLNLLTYPTVIN